MSEENVSEFSEFIRSVAEELDISPTKYQEAVNHYTAVGKWLDEGDFFGEVSLYPQGSFKLGTVVRPWRDGKDCDYDIDLVCEIQMEKKGTTPQTVKQSVGDRLAEKRTYKKRLGDEGKRCWTLNYAEDGGIGFHMDVLPSTPEEASFINQIVASGVSADLAQQSIAITHRNGNGSYSWSTSNPKGYAEWFQLRQLDTYKLLVQEQKQLIFNENQRIFASVEDVPDQLIKTPLQRAIQIMKRHRDIRFAGHILEDAKPISMIITTLAAYLYQGELDVFSALSNIIRSLDRYAKLLEPRFAFSEIAADLNLIKRMTDETWQILNPVNLGENFADRWHEGGHKRAKAFFQWVAWARDDLVDLPMNDSVIEMIQPLVRVLGDNPVKAAANKIGITEIGAPAVIGLTVKPEIVRIENPSRLWGLGD